MVDDCVVDLFIVLWGAAVVDRGLNARVRPRRLEKSGLVVALVALLF